MTTVLIIVVVILALAVVALAGATVRDRLRRPTTVSLDLPL
jgi:hypothetical protein